MLYYEGITVCLVFLRNVVSVIFCYLAEAHFGGIDLVGKMFSDNEIVKGFIVLEGLDGAGTTTQQKKLAEHLHRRNVPCYMTSEPTDSGIGKLIRNVLASKELVDRSTLARLFAADRNEHLYGQEGIMHHCAQGNVVICDRYFFSSLAYQGSDLGIEEVWELNKYFPLPEILFFLDIYPEDAENRYKSRKNLEIYEKKELQEQVRKNYNQVFSELSKTSVNFHRIDATQEVEEIFTELWRVLSSHPIVKE